MARRIIRKQTDNRTARISRIPQYLSVYTSRPIFSRVTHIMLNLFDRQLGGKQTYTHKRTQ